jgi:hypothetical protein
MADYVSVVTPNTDLTVADFDGRGPGTSTNLSTGDIRRKYNFGSRVSELAIPQDPFFRFLSMASKKPTDDPQFKYTEKRPSFNKRYAYVMGYVQNDGADEFADDTIEAYNDGGTGTSVAVGDTLKLYMAGDYKYQGNVQNIYGNTSNKIDVGASGTTPKFFLPGQLIKIPLMTESATAATTWGKGYLLARVSDVDASTWESTSKDSSAAKYPALVTCKIVKVDGSYGGFAGYWNNNFSPGAAEGDEVVADQSIASTLERARTYVVGSAHAEGSGFPETWIDQPYQSNHGLTQIWKTSMAMTNTARATVLKFESSEWARVWREKLIEHKWDVETSLLFGSQYTDGDSIQYTQGAVDYISSYGNAFSLAVATKSQDSFLDDLSNLLDPRYNNSGATVFFCSTEVYNWLHKLSGYFANNIGAVQPWSGGSPDTTAGQSDSHTSANMTLTGRKKVFGVDITTISTVYGDMNVARNVHLDGTNVKMLGVNMKNCAYRPLVGNGINRDTSVYVGVQTLENSGVDRRVDQILTEAGMEWSMAESHAIWT